MTERAYESQNVELDRSELFALGAAAGAVIAAAISSYLERRQPETALERAQAYGSDALASLQDATQLQGTGNPATKWWQGTRKSARRQAKAAKQAAGLGGATAGGLMAATSGKTGNKGRKYAEQVAERLVGDPYAVSGSIEETLKERFGNAGSALRGLTGRQGSGIGSTLTGILGGATGAASGYAATAQQSLQNAHLGEKARNYSETLADQAKRYATTAQKSLQEAHLGERAKEYGETLADYTTEATKATRQVAQRSATKLSAGAVTVAGAASEQASDLRKGVRKSAKRTRRRASWGFRSFVIGLAVGLLTAPQSGQRTRDIITSFVQEMLDVFMPNEQSSRF
jgi:hypothetical protein